MNSDYFVFYLTADGCSRYELFYSFVSAIEFIRSLPSDVRIVKIFKEV